MSNVFFIEPIASTNTVPSPSFEDPSNALDDYTAVDASLTRSLEQARFGRASGKVVTNGNLPAAGVFLTIDPSVATEPRACSVYVRGEDKVHMRVVDVTNSITWKSDELQLNNIHWQRLERQIVLGPLVCTELRIFVETPDEVDAITFFVDGFQVEAQGFSTTYIDGSLEDELDPHIGEAWFKWKGARHNSESTRSGRYRRAGRKVNVTQGLNSEIWPTQLTGFGMPPIQVNVEQFVDVDRLIVQRQRPQARALTMQFYASKDPDLTVGDPADLRPLHIAREALENIIKPDLVQETQPVIMRYENRRAGMEIPLFYETGLEWRGDRRYTFNNSFTVRFISEEPFYTVDSQDVCNLAPVDFGFANGLVTRIDGEWLLHDCNGDAVFVIEENPQTGEIWVGGSFTEIDLENGANCSDCLGVAIISRDGQTIRGINLGAATDPGVDGTVRAFAFAQSGLVYIGGDFTSFDAAATPAFRIVQYNPITDTLTPIGTDDGLDDVVRSLAVDRQEFVWVGGDFLLSELGSETGLNHFCEYIIGSDTFIPAAGANGDGVNDDVFDIEIDLDGVNKLIVGAFTQETGAAALSMKRVGKYDNFAYTQLGQDGSEETVKSACKDNAGNLYVAGPITNIGFNDVEFVAIFNRQDFLALGQNGDGLSGGTEARACDVRDDGLVIFGGDFSAATGVKSGFIEFLATWDGTRFGFTDISIDDGLGGTLDVTAVKWIGKDLWVGGDFSGNFQDHSSIQTCVNNGRAKTSPILEILGPADVLWLENQTTGQLVKFELEIKAGETVKVNLTPGKVQVKSDQRGIINQDLTADSDALELLPGDNRIAFFGVFQDVNTEFQLRLPVRAWSFDD